jgi:hypothetical protein
MKVYIVADVSPVAAFSIKNSVLLSSGHGRMRRIF